MSIVEFFWIIEPFIRKKVFRLWRLAGFLEGPKSRTSFKNFLISSNWTSPEFKDANWLPFLIIIGSSFSKFSMNTSNFNEVRLKEKLFNKLLLYFALWKLKLGRLYQNLSKWFSKAKGWFFCDCKKCDNKSCSSCSNKLSSSFNIGSLRERRWLRRGNYWLSLFFTLVSFTKTEI